MAYIVHSAFDPSSFSPRQNKATLQRQYRDREVECFNTLRDVIKGLTGEEPQTRQEILRKAIDLLLTLSENRRQRTAVEIPAVSPALYGLLPFIDPVDATATQARLGYSPQSAHCPQSWPTNTEFDAQGAYYTAPQYDSTFDMDFALVRAVTMSMAKDWSDYPQG